ncbi:MAG: hypothetical protein HGB29_05135 [Chlorobiaceae bacterium]|nr:hypothetical protein [Chlorobiaceae bacterium]
MTTCTTDSTGTTESMPAVRLIGRCGRERLTAIDRAWHPEPEERWLVKEGIAMDLLSRDVEK